ncbi:MAG TPA: hypothetical protein PK536_14015 [Ignavibacteria bacterium]|nr:hypothetical protein [Ignavibacteria bacterium]HRK00807.1 hypothetical protein [Ignavibacteria bacterium]
MDDLIKLVSEKAGITAEQAKSAIETIGGFVKDKLPAGLGDQVSNFLEGKSGGGLADMAKGLKDKLGL